MVINRNFSLRILVWVGLVYLIFIFYFFFPNVNMKMSREINSLHLCAALWFANVVFSAPGDSTSTVAALGILYLVPMNFRFSTIFFENNF